MSRKLIIAGAALAAIVGATLVSTVSDAEAARGGAGFSRGGGVRMTHGGGARSMGMRGVHRTHRVGIARHHMVRRGHHVRHLRHGHHVRHFHWRHRHGWCWRHPIACRSRYVGWRPYLYTAPAVVATAYAATPTVSRCTCLTKEYLPDGSALFRDVCTKEEALMPNPNLQTSQVPQAR